MIKLLDGLGNGLAEGRLVRSALRGVLSVDKRIVALAVARAVGDGHLDILARKVDRRIERLLGHGLVEQVQQSVFRNVAPAVEREGKAQIQVGVVPDHLLDILHVVGVGAEDLLIDPERDERAVLLPDAALPPVALFDALGEGYRTRLAVADRTCREGARKHVHGLDTHAVQTHGLLEGRAAVLAARVHLRNGRGKRLERNAASVVADRYDIILDGDVDAVSGTHDELVHRVVDHLLDQDVDAVVGLRAVAQLADIHARTQPDVLPGREGYDGIVTVVVRIRIE